MLGELVVHMAGGTDREGGGSGPVVVLLHGFGAPGTDLVPLFRQLSVGADVRFVFPEAPIALDPGYGAGRAWWMIDLARLQRAVATGERGNLVSEVPEGLPGTREMIFGMLDALEREHSAPRSRVILGGFSQGAMLATDVALRDTEPPAGLVVLSGSLICEPEWTALLPRRKGLRVLQSHGRADPILPIGIARELRDLFAAAGLPSQWIEFSGGHGIPNQVVEAMNRFVQDTFAVAPAAGETRD